jgi:predicted Zn-dependent protease with MMP-like domain
MKTRQFTSLKEAVLAVQGKKQGTLTESVEAPALVQAEQTQVPAELVEYITTVICEAENKLNAKFTAEEITETTEYILGQLQVDALIESIQEKVGFELNESEIQYVLENLNETE